jgi:hypothetical protein
MSTPNPNPLSPVPPFPERGRVVADRIVAENPRRQGPRQAEEGLWRDPIYSSSFVAGVQADLNDHVVVETKIAPNARGRLASGQEIPAWNAVDDATKDGFWQGLSGSEQSVTVRPVMRESRPGGNRTLTPLRGLLAGERPGTVYSKSIAPPFGGRGRINEADCTWQ